MGPTLEFLGKEGTTEGSLLRHFCYIYIYIYIYIYQLTNQIIYIQIYETVTKGLLSNPQQRRQKLVKTFLMIIYVCPFCKLDSLKILIGLNHFKCTDRTSNKSGFSLSLDIVPTKIDDESQNQLPQELKILTI